MPPVVREPRRKLPLGCTIALVAGGIITLVCGVGSLFLGWSAYSNPRVRLGVRAAGAAMEMTQAAIEAPGAAELRGIGCISSMVYAPDLMERFIADLAVDGGQVRAPRIPLVVCAVRTGAAAPPCDEVARTAGTGREGGEEAAVVVWTGGSEQSVCAGVHDRAGERVRDLDADEGSFASITRPRGL